MSTLHRRVAAIAASLALMGGIAFTAGPAAAAPPGNDTQAGAVNISALPFHLTQSTTEATVDAGENEARDYCLGVGAPAFEHAVWFKTTIPSGLNQAVRVDVTGSDYGVGIAVLAESGGTLSAIDCVPGVYLTPGAPPAGTFYLVLFGDGTTAATGGNLDVAVDFVPPPPDISMTIDRTGTATKEGGAWISGTVTCTGGGNGAVFGVDGSITQRVGRLIISSSFFSGESIPCDSASYPWRAYAPPTNGRFSGGKSLAVSTAFGCNDGGCNAGYAEATVKLNRAAVK